MAGTAQKLSGISIHCRFKHGVLVCLRRGQLQGLILAFQRADVVLVQRIQHGPSIGVLIIDNISRGILDRVLRSRRASGDVIPHALDRALGLAAAGRQLGGKIVEALLGLVAQLTDGGIDPVEPVVDGVGQSVSAVTDAVLDGVDPAL